MPSAPLAVAANLERADGLLRRASEAGAELAVLPEMFNTGYGLQPDYAPYAEAGDGPTLAHLSGLIPRKVALDLDIPVVFANQCGATRTTIPVLRTQIADRFAGLSSLCDGRHGLPIRAGAAEEVVLSSLTVVSSRGSQSCRS